MEVEQNLTKILRQICSSTWELHHIKELTGTSRFPSDLYYSEIDKDYKTVKQSIWQVSLRFQTADKEEIQKLFKIGFMKKAGNEYTLWVYSFGVTKHNRKIWICLKLHDFNHASTLTQERTAM